MSQILSRTARAVSGVLALVLLSQLSGCTGAYRDPHARTFGEVTDDLAIGTKVKSGLFADKQVSGLRINVDVRQGVVTLRGRVPSAEAAERARAIAAAVKGVSGVTVQLRYPETSARHGVP